MEMEKAVRKDTTFTRMPGMEPHQPDWAYISPDAKKHEHSWTMTL